jgi:nicotinamidase-related amidase
MRSLSAFREGAAMANKNHDLHGSAPDKSAVALLLIDVINDLEFEGGERLLPHAREMAHSLARLKSRAKRSGVPVVYANDNFGKWQSDFKRLLSHCLEDGVRGREVAALLKPDDDDYFVLKPKHSGFFSTTLDTLLQYLQAKTLIVTGLATDICVLFTANDAYMRDFKLFVPSDCVAAEDPAENRRALEHMRRVLKADIRPSAEIDFDELRSARTDMKPAQDQEKIFAAR